MDHSMPKPNATLIERLALEADYQAAWGYEYAGDLMKQAIKEIERLKRGQKAP